jgi:predicted CoA-substrate-specific enzyme activase
MMDKDIWIGIDVGAISVKLAVFIRDGQDNDPVSELAAGDLFFVPEKIDVSSVEGCFLFSRYARHHGDASEKVTYLLRELFRIFNENRVAGVWITGSGGKRLQKRWGFPYVNEYRAAAEGMGFFYPDVSTVFALGGERSKYIQLSREENGEAQIVDYETNGECAAGTGSFFDQQVDRLKYPIEDVGKIVETVDRSASIAGRCSVFAKSDMIHAQQRGYQPPEVLKGLCNAVVRNYKGSITKGKHIQGKVGLIGGVASNEGVVNALREQFGLMDGGLVVPEYAAWMEAAGAALIGWKNGALRIAISEDLGDSGSGMDYPTTEPLSMEKVVLLRDRISEYRFENNKINKIIDVYLGVDVGSVSTNLALINDDGDVVAGIYRMTEGRPVEIVRDAFREMAASVNNKVRIRGVGTTGSGRDLVGLLIGADVVKDEITAHKTGAMHVSRRYLNREVDTIFEVGGQDSKYISLKDGVVVDFSLNEACAAGTGSFLEEQAKQIGIAIRDEFAELALRSEHPLKLGERCTVFMEKELVPYLHQGVPKEDITAGLALSVVQNYLNRVVKKRRIGDVIFFQGGTAYNDSVAAAFATILDKEIIVPPHNGIIGAIGAALLAQESMREKEKSSFRGWDLGRVAWRQKEFTCKSCSNECIIQEFDVEGEKSYWGDKCSDRYRQRTKTHQQAEIRDLIRFRDNLMHGLQSPCRELLKKRGSVGFPGALLFYDRLPFWQAYFGTLGYEVVLTSPSRQKTIDAGVEACVAEPCFPIQMAVGHLKKMMNREVDFIFLPNVLNEEDPTDSVASFICPWTQTIPLVTRHIPQLSEIRDRLFYPNVQFRIGKKFVEHQLRKAVARLGISKRQNRHALTQAYEAQSQFREKIVEEGRIVIDHIAEAALDGVVLLGRPYNLYDPGLNLNIPTKLRNLYGVNVIPMDFLNLDYIDVRSVHDHMFWNYGRRILQAARFTKDYPNLHIIYLSNFKCGPDSYVRHYVEEASGKPFLFLQLDSHANDAGVMTRIEAFLESKGLL